MITLREATRALKASKDTFRSGISVSLKMKSVFSKIPSVALPTLSHLIVMQWRCACKLTWVIGDIRLTLCQHPKLSRVFVRKVSFLLYKLLFYHSLWKSATWVALYFNLWVCLQGDNSPNLTHPWTFLTNKTKKKAAHQSVKGHSMPYRHGNLAHSGFKEGRWGTYFLCSLCQYISVSKTQDGMIR